ncbi:MAG: hypothetical protein ACE5WD_01760 [Candidatus Aminicenantia bacterium]
MSKKGSAKLIKNGWTKRFIACEPQLSEAVKLYEELGLEVHLEPLNLSESNECNLCYDPKKYKIIYTRVKKTKHS